MNQASCFATSGRQQRKHGAKYRSLPLGKGIRITGFPTKITGRGLPHQEALSLENIGMEEIIQLNSVSDYNQLRGAETLYPLVTVLDQHLKTHPPQNHRFLVCMRCS